MPALSVIDGGELPSVYRVSDFAAASIGAAGLAVSELVAQGGSAPAVTVDQLLASAWFGSAVRPVGWTLPSVWDAYALNYPAADGWIRLHTNLPAHRAAALAVLGFGSEPDPIDVRIAVSHRSAVELEDAVVAAGGSAAVMRSRDEWLRHPQGVALAASPLMERSDGTPGRPGAGWRPTPGRPLAGLRVLDLTRVIAGPVATRFLAGLGADVLRIDPPWWNEDALVPNMMLGKRSATLDLRAEGDRERLIGLLEGADVLVHGYRHGAVDGLGLDPGERARLRPGLVDISLDAYGFTGPWASRRGFDSLVQMSSGIAERGMRWAGDERPHPLPVQALDHATGYLLAAAAIRGVSRLRAEGVGSVARTSLARVAEALVAGGEREVGAQVDSWAGTREPIDTFWGPAEVLPAPLSIGGVRLGFDTTSKPLGSDAAAWA